MFDDNSSNDIRNGNRRNNSAGLVLARSKSSGSLTNNNKPRTLGELLSSNEQAPGNTTSDDVADEGRRLRGGGVAEKVEASKEEMLRMLQEAACTGGFDGVKPGQTGGSGAAAVDVVNLKVTNPLPVLRKLHPNFPVALSSPTRKATTDGGGSSATVGDCYAVRLLSASVPNLDFDANDFEDDEEDDNAQAGATAPFGGTKQATAEVSDDDDEDFDDDFSNVDFGSPRKSPRKQYDPTVTGLSSSGIGIAGLVSPTKGGGLGRHFLSSSEKSGNDPMANSPSGGSMMSAGSEHSSKSHRTVSANAQALAAASIASALKLQRKGGGAAPPSASPLAGSSRTTHAAAAAAAAATAPSNLLNMDAASIQSRKDKMMLSKSARGPDSPVKSGSPVSSMGKGSKHGMKKKPQPGPAPQEDDPAVTDDDGVVAPVLARSVSSETPQALDGDPSSASPPNGIIKSKKVASKASKDPQTPSSGGKTPKRKKQKIKITPADLGLSDDESKDPAKLQEALKRWKDEKLNSSCEDMSVMSADLPPGSPTKRSGRRRERGGTSGEDGGVGERRRGVSRGRSNESMESLPTSPRKVRGRAAAAALSSDDDDEHGGSHVARVRRRRSVSRHRSSRGGGGDSVAGGEKEPSTPRRSRSVNRRMSSKSTSASAEEEEPATRRCRSVGRKMSSKSINVSGEDDAAGSPSKNGAARRTSIDYSVASTGTEITAASRTSRPRSKSLARGRSKSRARSTRGGEVKSSTPVGDGYTPESPPTKPRILRSKSLGRPRESDEILKSAHTTLRSPSGRDSRTVAAGDSNESSEAFESPTGGRRRTSLDTSTTSLTSAMSMRSSRTQLHKNTDKDRISSRGRTNEPTTPNTPRSKSRGRKLLGDGDDSKSTRRSRSLDVRKSSKEKRVVKEAPKTPKTPKPIKKSTMVSPPSADSPTLSCYTLPPPATPTMSVRIPDHELVTPESTASRSRVGGISSRISALKSAFTKGGKHARPHPMDPVDDSPQSVQSARPTLSSLPAPSFRVLDVSESPSAPEESPGSSPRRNGSFNFWAQKAGQASHETQPSPSKSPAKPQSSSKKPARRSSSETALTEPTVEWDEVDFSSLKPGSNAGVVTRRSVLTDSRHHCLRESDEEEDEEELLYKLKKAGISKKQMEKLRAAGLKITDD